MELSKIQISTFNALKRIDWSINRSKVNNAKRWLEKLSEDEVEQLKVKYPEYSWIFDELFKRIKANSEKKNQRIKIQGIVTDKIFKKFYDPIEKELLPEIKDNAEKYSERLYEQLKEKSEFYFKINSMSISAQRSDPDPNIRNYFNSKRYKSDYNAYNIIRDPSSLDTFLLKSKKFYINTELDKLKWIIGKVLDKLPTLTELKLTSHTSRQFTFTVLFEGNEININIEAIPAGGYNIQKFHYRWLAQFRLDGKLIKFEK